MHTNQISILPAHTDDVESLADLLYLLFTQESDFKPDRIKQLNGLKLILSNPEKGFILVAKVQGMVIGMVSVLTLISTAEGGEVGLLEDMIVHPEHHGKGIGSRLLEQAKQRAKEQGLSRLTLLTDAGNDSAQRFYKKHGFSSSGMTPLRIQL